MDYKLLKQLNRRNKKTCDWKTKITRHNGYCVEFVDLGHSNNYGSPYLHERTIATVLCLIEKGNLYVKNLRKLKAAL